MFIIRGIGLEDIELSDEEYFENYDYYNKLIKDHNRKVDFFFTFIIGVLIWVIVCR